jgi:hypothetical protein
MDPIADDVQARLAAAREVKGYDPTKRQKRPRASELLFEWVGWSRPLRNADATAANVSTPTPRVRLVKHARDGHDKGRYRTLAQKESNYQLSSKAGEAVTTSTATSQVSPLKFYPPVPDIMIYQGWLYVTGDAPHVGTRAVIAQAEGCRLLLYYHPTSGSDANKYARICYLEGNPGQVLWLYPIVTPAPNRFSFLTPGTFVDAEVNDDGNFVKWRNRPSGDPEPQVQMIDSLPNNDVHWEILGQVDEGRDQFNID